ncbi:hypothetical protein GGS23DRAFT_224378 [Durotheca rogersii]|uniref:uncharacterized protein n=1 Tax=Durotheca rogersii TaxID=419775 RepID=UPI0022207280|nr:uncharacterized protein GGS23DRAFT_224378 [Durotheca rogersii]KAI5860463.1 hypothetical protein GGS23DRAFT_224378 [Durotheca rogersii]
MVVGLDAHQTSLEPFGLWTARHAHPDDAGLSAGRARYFRLGVTAPTSPPPSVIRALKTGGSSGGNGGSGDGADREALSSGLAKIQVELHSCQASPINGPRPRPRKSDSAPVFPQSEDIGQDEKEANALSTVGQTEGIVFCFPREPVESPVLFRATKRLRPLHDVDGPWTSGLSCKKRRLRLHLVTSRLSLPFSLPATHILNRESGEDTPVLSRFLKLAALGAKKAGHQSGLIRKAAVLNRVRISVRQAAVLRGHTVLAGMAARGNLLSHGLQVVTSSSTGARFPGRSPPHDYQMPSAWRPHTTEFRPPCTITNLMAQGSSPDGPGHLDNDVSVPMPTSSPLLPGLDVIANPVHLPLHEEDEDDVAFPSPDLDTRYADLSDDDLGDVYADFGAIFGSATRSPESGSGESGGDEHFYEEYLDELDGIRWMA